LWGEIQLYEIQQQQIIKTTKLIQTFSNEHPSSDWITCLLQINPNTLVSSSYTLSSYSSPSDNVIVIWSKSSESSSFYEPIQRITGKEAEGEIGRLVLLKQKKEEVEEEEEFASCSSEYDSIIIWRREKGGKGEFQIKQKIENVYRVETLIYISLANELISGSTSYSYLLQIWSPSSSSSDFVEKQKIQIPSEIVSLCQINKNDSNRIEFAIGNVDGQIMIWSKQINESNHYSLIRTLQSFNIGWVDDLIFINDKGFDFLIACSQKENKIKIFKGEEEEELEHKDVVRLIPISNGQFASGGLNQCLNIWSPSFSSP